MSFNDTLIIFDSEGYPLNLKYQDGLFKSTLLAEKCSAGTYTTKSIFLMQMTPGFVITEASELKNIEWFNSDGINFYPVSGSAQTTTITNIENLNTSSQYKTKWVYGLFADRRFPKNSYVHIEGVTLNSDFDNSGAEKKVFKVLDTKKDAILIATNSPNSTPITPINYSSATISAVNVIELKTKLNIFTEWSNTSDFYVNKPLTVRGSESNDNVYTISKIINYSDLQESKAVYSTLNSFMSGDVMSVELTDLDITDLTDSNNDGIADTQIPVMKSASLTIGVDKWLSFSQIAKTLNSLTTKHTVYTNRTGFYVKANNESSRFSLVMKKNNVPVAITNNYYTIPRFCVNEALISEFNTSYADFGQRVLRFQAIGTNFTVRVNGINYPGVNTGTIFSSLSAWVTVHQSSLADRGVNVTNVGNRLVFDLPSVDQIVDIDIIKGSGTNAEFLLARYTFDVIDERLTFNIDGVDYSVDFNTDIPTTISDFISTHGSTLTSVGLELEQNVEMLSFYMTDLELTFSHSVDAGILGIYQREDFDVRGAGCFLSSNELICSAMSSLPLYVGQVVDVTGSNLELNDRQYTILGINPTNQSRFALSYEGPFFQDNTTLTLTSRDSFRYPRDGKHDALNVKLRATLIHSEEDEAEKPFTILDLSGENLSTTGRFSYTGVKPLWIEPSTCDKLPSIPFNIKPNIDESKRDVPSAQQNIFEQVIFSLPNEDEITDKTIKPSALPINIVFRSKYEGVHMADLKFELVEELTYELETDVSQLTPLVTEIIPDTNKVILRCSGDLSTVNFLAAGFKIGQRIVISASDTTNLNFKSPWYNQGIEGIITNVAAHEIWFNSTSDIAVKYESSRRDFKNPVSPFNMIDTGMTVSITLLPIDLGTITLGAETVIEDERYKTLMENYGLKIGPKELNLFETTPLAESGTDWVFLNEKRKELLTYYRDIWNKIGSYRSLIDTIAFFGWDTLKVNEYYRNINVDSDDYGQLTPIELNNILRRDVEGWVTQNPIKKRDKNYQKTNFLGLAIPWTDLEGDFTLVNSLEDTFTKLYGLSDWLKRNVIPLTIHILDIRAEAYLPTTTYMYHTTNQYRQWEDVQDAVSIPQIEFTASLTGVYTEKGNLIPPVECENVDDIRRLTSNWNCRVELKTDLVPTNDYSLEVRTYSRTGDVFSLVQSMEVFNKSTYLFTVDEVIDPYVEIKVNLHNGYGTCISHTNTFTLV